LHDRGFRFTVSVNISMKQFGHDEFVIDVDEALVSSGFDPSLLVLEFPLSVITGDDETATGELNLLRNRVCDLQSTTSRPVRHTRHP